MNYFIILAYNEAQNLPRLFTSLQTVASSMCTPYKVILVNDGSTDRTVAVAHEFGQTLPIQIESHTSNQGVAQGFRTGFRAAASLASDDDIIFTMEADNTGDPALLPTMAAKIRSGTDVVLASCYAPGGGVLGVSFERKLMSECVNLFMRIVFPVKRCHTYSSFYRAYSGKVIKRALNHYGDQFIQSQGFTVAAEILFQLRRLQANIDEIPAILRFGERAGKSKMKVGRTIKDYVTFLFREVKKEREFHKGKR